MTHHRIKYLERFHEKGYRVTRQRQAILDALCMADGHATVAEVYRRARALDEGLDKSTVYRALDLFVGLGLVIIGDSLSGERVYELIQEEPHHHLICKGCGAEVEVENRVVDDFYRQMQRAYGYRVEMDHLIVFGVCPGCEGVS